MRRQGLPAAALGDGGVGREGLDQRLVAGVGRGEGLQPVRDAVPSLGGAKLGCGVIAGRTDAPFLGELAGGQAETMLGPRVFEDRRAQQPLTLGLLGLVAGGHQAGHALDVAERAGSEPLLRRLGKSLQHRLALGRGESRVIRREGRRLAGRLALRLSGLAATLAAGRERHAGHQADRQQTDKGLGAAIRPQAGVFHGSSAGLNAKGARWLRSFRQLLAVFAGAALTGATEVAAAVAAGAASAVVSGRRLGGGAGPPRGSPWKRAFIRSAQPAKV